MFMMKKLRNEETSLRKNELIVKHLAFGFFAAAITTYMLLSSPHINNESAPTLIIFNFLFVSLIFPLNGALKTKIFMLLIGNVIDLLWSNLFFLFVYASTYYFGEIFNALYVILNPLINIVWIVSFYCISLTVLASSENRKKRG